MRIVVFGYGAVGRETAALFAARGDDVIVAQRHAPARLPHGIRFIASDFTARESVANACKECDIVICAVGLPYDWRVWERAWPAAIDALLSACETTGARFIFADNLYMAGPQTSPLTEAMPLTDYGHKPRLRSQLTRMWQTAHQSGRVRAVAVRASDFYGPNVSTSVLSAFGVAKLMQGQPALIPYSPDFPHDFTYVPDFAHAIVTLVDAPDDAYGQAWNVPNAPAHTLRELLALAAQIANVPLRVRVIPAWLIPVIGLFSREVHELREMRFQTDRPYRVDATKYQTRFGGHPTPFEKGLSATVEFYRRTASA